MTHTTHWNKLNSFKGNFTSPSLAFHRSCPVCDSLCDRTVLQLEDFQFYTDCAQVPKRLDIRQVQCLKCFALYLNPCYSSLGFRFLFEEAGQSYGATAGRSQEQVEWLTKRNLLEPEATVLDVGCFEGRFLAQLPSHVAKVGVDIDYAAIERGRKQLQGNNVEFIHGDFESFEFSGNPDLITMFHVLEHLPRPLSALGKLRSLAQASTSLVVEVPILEKGITNDINGFFSVQHMTHFSRQSLANSIAHCGWKIVEWCEQPGYNGCRVLARPDAKETSVESKAQDQISLCEYLAAWQAAISNVSRVLASMDDQERCVIWGGGAHTEFLYQTTIFFQSSPDREYVLVDADPIKHGKSWRGIPIYPPSVLEQLDPAPLLISSYGSQEEISQQALQLGVKKENLIKLYEEVRIY